MEASPTTARPGTISRPAPRSSAGRSPTVRSPRPSRDLYVTFVTRSGSVGPTRNFTEDWLMRHFRTVGLASLTVGAALAGTAGAGAATPAQPYITLPGVLV